jgi:hypothetical protein
MGFSPPLICDADNPKTRRHRGANRQGSVLLALRRVQTLKEDQIERIEEDREEGVGET